MKYPIRAGHPVHEEQALRFSFSAVHILSVDTLSGHLQIENRPLPRLQWRHRALMTDAVVFAFWCCQPLSKGFLNSQWAGHPDYHTAPPEGWIPWLPCALRQAVPLLFRKGAPVPFLPCRRRHLQSSFWRL